MYLSNCQPRFISVKKLILNFSNIMLRKLYHWDKKFGPYYYSLGQNMGLLRLFSPDPHPKTMPLRNFEMKTWKHAQVFIIIKYADEYENFHFFFQIMYSEDKTEIAKYDINN